MGMTGRFWALVLAIASAAFGASFPVALAEPVRAGARDWIFSGSEMLAALEGREGHGMPSDELRRALSVARAQAYIAGVADSLSRSRWCGAGSVLPHEFSDRVYSYLRALPQDRLKENASMLATEALAAAFPCHRR